MTKRFLIIVIILFSMTTSAQERISSPYSFYGIGLNTFNGTVENQSMGGLGFLSDSIHVNLQNPAAYGRLKLTTYTIGVGHSSVAVESGDQTGSTKSTSLDYLAIGIPTGKFGFGFGIIPYTTVGYNILEGNQEESSVSQFSGSGGLNKVFLSGGYELSKNLSLGLDISYNFGNIENKNIFIQEGLQFGSREINRSDLSGFTYKFGLDYSRMVKEDLEFSFGAYYSPKADINSENSRELATILFSPMGRDYAMDAREFDVDQGDLTLPASFSIGTGLGEPRKWFLGVEYTGSEASDFSNRSFAVEGATYEQSSSYGVGGYFIPDYSSLTSYFNRIVYRAGFNFEETGLNLGGEAINQFGISFGVGLPVGRMFSNVNVGFEYGQRGTTSSNLVQENFFNAKISLSLNDRWFIKRKFE